MVTYKVHLIRTGTTGDGVSPRRFAGNADVSLSEYGEKSLSELVNSMSYPYAEAVYTSPLSRCVRTAAILYPEVTAVKAEGFTDMDLGEFKGKTFDELKDNPDYIKWISDSAGSAPPGGEETAAFARRVVLAAGDIFTGMMRQGSKSAAIITHGGVIMTLLASIGLPKMPIQSWAVDNGFGYTLLLTPQMWMRDRAVEVFAPIPGGPVQAYD